MHSSTKLTIAASTCAALLAYLLPLPTTTPIIEASIINMSIPRVSRTLAKAVLSQETAEGVGAIVRRTIGTSQLRNLSPFLMFDHFSATPGAGFPDHPHRGQATVSYMIQGSSQHEDSEGHRGIIGPGDLQWMTAGRGIIHSEVMPITGPGLPNPIGLQLWVDLPKEYKMTAPTYQELKAEDIPSAYPKGEDGPVIKVISGESYGVKSPVRPLGGCWYFDITLKAGQSVFQTIPNGWTAFIYTYAGSLILDPESPSSQPQKPYYTLVLSAAANQTGVQLEAAEDNTRAFLIAGEPLDQKVVQHGPFVMTSQEDIQKTLMDYRFSRNGFEKAGTWRSEIGNA